MAESRVSGGFVLRLSIFDRRINNIANPLKYPNSRTMNMLHNKISKGQSLSNIDCRSTVVEGNMTFRARGRACKGGRKKRKSIVGSLWCTSNVDKFAIFVQYFTIFFYNLSSSLFYSLLYNLFHNLFNNLFYNLF